MGEIAEDKPEKVAAEPATTSGSSCDCTTECDTNASSISCKLHGKNPDYRLGIKLEKGKKKPKFPKAKKPNPNAPTAEDIGAETMGAIKEFHGHMKYDMKRNLKKGTKLSPEAEVLTTSLNTVLHMNADPPQETDEETDKTEPQSDGGEAAPQPEKKKSNNRRKGSFTKPKPPATMSSQQEKLDETEAEHLEKGQSRSDCPRYKFYKKYKPPTYTVSEDKYTRLPRKKVYMPRMPPTQGYKWSYRRYAPETDKVRLKDIQQKTLTPPLRWVLVPETLKVKKQRPYDYLKDAKYGYRDQMDPNDFSVTNQYHFPPFCYPITEPLRFPFLNFNTPPFLKRAPLVFTKPPYTDKVEETSDYRSPMLTVADIRTLVEEEYESSREQRRRSVDTDDDAWGGYRPKYLTNPVQFIKRYEKVQA